VVSLWDIDPDALESAATHLATRGRVHTVTVDVSDPVSVESAAAGTVRDLGGIDILVANAGIAGPNFKTWEYPVAEWRRIIDVNLLGIYYCCRAIVPVMLNQRYGRIVNVASIAGKEGNPTASAYSASKAGVIALTKSLGKELAAENIAVNCITPAAARTRIFDQMSQAHIDFMLSKIPRGRFVTPEEIASLIAWVASEENSFTTAAVFDISGGRATY
jgi:3-oxoacyl-[acyl-carrier protein] reductase